MGVIRFPEEVQTRLEFLSQIRLLEEKFIPPLKHFTKAKALLPISIGVDVPKYQRKGSLTTTAIAAARLPRSAQGPSFALLFKKADNLARRRAVPSETFGQNNPITMSFIGRAYDRLDKADHSGHKFAIRSLIEWLEDPPEELPLRGYPAVLVEEALSRSSSTLTETTAMRRTKAINSLYGWARDQVLSQIAFFHSSHSAYFDSGELAFLTLLACRLGSLYWTSPIVTSAMRIIFETQAEDGLWHSNKPFWYASGRGYFVATAQIMGAILPILRKRTDLYSIHEKKIDRYISWLTQNLAEADHNDPPLFGWAAEADHSRRRVDFYITLENMRVIRQIRKILSALNRDSLLRRSGITVKWEPMRWGKLLDTDLQKASNNRLKTRMLAMFVKPYKAKKKLERCSMVLYGPPGTSKTTIGEALADILGPAFSPWPFVTITPGDFIAGGEQMAEINAANIFRVLTELSEVVVLFDEIDQLVRDRNQETFSQG